MFNPPTKSHLIHILHIHIIQIYIDSKRYVGILLYSKTFIISNELVSPTKLWVDTYSSCFHEGFITIHSSNGPLERHHHHLSLTEYGCLYICADKTKLRWSGLWYLLKILKFSHRISRFLLGQTATDSPDLSKLLLWCCLPSCTHICSSHVSSRTCTEYQPFLYEYSSARSGNWTGVFVWLGKALLNPPLGYVSRYEIPKIYWQRLPGFLIEWTAICRCCWFSLLVSSHGFPAAMLALLGHPKCR